MNQQVLGALLAALAMGPVALAQPGLGLDSSAVVETHAAEADFAGRTWIVKSSDSICGLREASQLSSPAVVDHDALLKATPEMKKLEREGIDPSSPKGVQLKAKAADRVAEAAEDVRKAQGHCSVWKAVRHKDGRSVQDVTSLVMAQL